MHKRTCFIEEKGKNTFYPISINKNSPWQEPNLHTPLMQSAPLIHEKPSAHVFFPEHGPPQSTNLSY
jgi:hypothetical protein